MKCKRFTPVLSYLTLVIVLAACNSTPSTLLVDSVCSPPCWQNIIPGETTTQEAFERLQSNKAVEQGSIEFRGSPWNIFNDMIDFSLSTGEKGSIYFIDDIASLISFYDDIQYKVIEVIDQFGNPESVIHYREIGPAPIFGGIFHTVIVGLKQEEGISWEVDQVDPQWDAEIQPESRLTGIDFFYPPDFVQLLSAGMFGPSTEEWMQPWSGYGPIATVYPLPSNR